MIHSTMKKLSIFLALWILLPAQLFAEPDPSHLVRLLKQESEAGIRGRGLEQKFEF